MSESQKHDKGLKGYLHQLENSLELYLVKKAPAIPKGGKEFIVKLAPWLVIIGALFGVFTILMFFWIHAELSEFRLGDVGVAAVFMAYKLYIVLIIVIVVIQLMALHGLFNRRKAGWNLIFYATLLSAVSYVITMDLGALIIGAKNYGSLNTVLRGANHTLSVDPVVNQWDRMGHFYASLEAGHVTASTALRRLTGLTEKNQFYQANLYLGRILKTEHILTWMVDPYMRKRTRKGLLKTEQIHQLARDITYGNRGRLKGKSLEDINSSGNCTAILIAAITYWQAKEISKVIKEKDPEAAGVDITLLAYISPIECSYVTLYGEYKLNKELVK